MIVIKIDEVRAEVEAQKNYKPSIRIISTEVVKEAKKAIQTEVAKTVTKAAQSRDLSEDLKQSLIWDLDNQERDLRIHRAKLSNMYLPMIADDAGTGELAAHYQKIESVSDDMRQVYDRREHVRKYGRLPNQGSAGAMIDQGNILALKDLRNSLKNRRYKMRKKIEVAEAKGNVKLPEMKLKLDQMDVEFEDVCGRIKEIGNG